MSIDENKHYIKSLDTFISSKVIFHDYLKDEDTIHFLFIGSGAKKKWMEKEINAKGLTVVPLRLYLRNGLAKIELGLARGKKRHDKRQLIIERDRRREADRAIKNRRV